MMTKLIMIKRIRLNHGYVNLIPLMYCLRLRYLAIQTCNNVSIVEKSAVCLGADWDRGGALFLATSHFSFCTSSVNSGILAGAAGNSLLTISLYLRHTLRILCCKSLSPDIFSNELPAAPAKIPEFTLDVQKEK